MTLDKAPREITPAPPRRVLVGYEGSAGSHAALERAVDAAGDDGGVFVVHAYALPHSWLGHPNYQERLDAALYDADSTISELWERTGPLDRVAWESEIIGGDAANAITAVAAARHADEIVVGSSSFDLARGLLGSVARDLIRVADVPVTVIPRGLAARPAAEAA
jgi:nucleotide-binding universal stress UspA family protein